MFIQNLSQDTGRQTFDSILNGLPISSPFTSHHLFEQGFNRREISRLLKYGSIQAIGKGVYARDQSRFDLGPCVAFLARRFPGLHLGGTTALVFHGMIPATLAHERPQFWSSGVVRLPHWFIKCFSAPLRTCGSARSGLPDGLGIEADEPSTAPMSVPERALLEMLANVGTSQAIDEAAQIARRLGLLRHDALAQLLAGCRNGKVLRLTHLLGNDSGHAWANAAHRYLLPEICSRTAR